MNNQTPLAQSGERLSFFQLFSIKRLKVEIPIIQRDFAQGRENQSAVRTAFLDALYVYLQEGRPNRDLDFVYGRVIPRKDTGRLKECDETAGQFIPLDGQQRLTTLFLLHWYLAQISGKADFLREYLSVNGRSLFTYETRSSSREFCDSLMSNDVNFGGLLTDKKGQESVALTIQDAGWFFLSWASDPTIRAMLTMLEAIHQKFAGHADFFDRLVDEELPVITFLYLNLHEFKLTDDLYIKMNSRGKPLTHFENFKARLEKKLKSFDAPWPEFRLGFRQEVVSGYEYFIHKIDTDWADVFWGYRNEATKDNTYDDELMNLIALVVANEHILKSEGESGLFGLGGKLLRLSFVEYDECGCLSQDYLIKLMTVLDLLHHGGTYEGRVRPYLDANLYYDEEITFKRVISNISSYPEKLRFYAFYGAVAKGMRDSELIAWMRIVFNLTENTIFNTVTEYYRALKSIQELLSRDQSILDLLKADVEISGFIKDQIIEEKIKAHLITSYPEWQREIVELEGHPFFRGQIGFILKFAGIVGYYFENGDTNWVDQVGDFLDRFRHYARAASGVFSRIDKGSEKISYAWERAVLTKGLYLTGTTANRFNLLSTRLTKNNIERDHSWKRLLRSLEKSHQWDERQSFVKAVLDDPDFDLDDVSRSLETICRNALNTSEERNWRMMLIEEPKLWSLCNQGFIAKHGEQVFLLHELQRNHLHSELHSKYLVLMLTNENFNASPFSHVKYLPSRASDVYPCLSFSSLRYDDGFYGLKIWYESTQYQFEFVEECGEPYPEELVTILDVLGFLAEERDEDSEFLGFRYSCKTSQEARDKLATFCEALRILKDD
ncbi:DUF262 domain-containing protein [Shewanella xiamenensis]|uniref:DUF262 domain-containing protein n=1 Tax=Shewanella TaxID=22 RepID=UPI000C12A2AC|nr:DUF262 domain-containing protein [Shewanella xiamenensis]PHY62765.1 hypothetical protein CS023_12895 [Shewanella xiamenensis]